MIAQDADERKTNSIHFTLAVQNLLAFAAFRTSSQYRGSELDAGGGVRQITRNTPEFQVSAQNRRHANRASGEEQLSSASPEYLPAVMQAAVGRMMMLILIKT